MFDIRYAYISDAKDLAKIHSNSWKVSYKGIIPDEILIKLIRSIISYKSI